MKLRALLLTDLVALGWCSARAADLPARPNILWITSEDHGPQMGCYGDTFATTVDIKSQAWGDFAYTMEEGRRISLGYRVRF